MKNEGNSLSATARKRLLASLELSQSDLNDRLAKASNAAYWKALYPGFSVCDEAAARPAAVPLANGTLDKIANDLSVRGFCVAENAIGDEVVEPLRACVETIRQAGWPPVFAYVFDQFWLVWRLAPVAQIAAAGLGEGYRWISHGWCHYVQPVSGAAGWPPHVDGNLPNRMSVWIPLSDATLDNGCMYVIPGNLNTSGIGERRALKTATNLQLRELMQRGRALPARAGSLLGWYFRILHWGSVCQLPGNPRVSIVMEFIGPDERPLSGELPLVDAQGALPSLTQRLYAIGRAIQHYQRFELKMRRYADLGRALMLAYRDGFQSR